MRVNHLVRVVHKIPKLFAVMKHGLKGYKGEYSMWSETVWAGMTSLNIFVRINEEMQRVSNKKMDFYPYYLTNNNILTLDYLSDKSSEIDIFFTPIKKNQGWPEDEPDPRQIKWSRQCTTRYTRISADGLEIDKIPWPIRLGGGGGIGYGLLIKNLEYYTYGNRLTLNFTDTKYAHIKQGTPIKRSLSGSLSFGVYTDDPSLILKKKKYTTSNSKGFELKVIARAKLRPPYYAMVSP